MCNSRHICINLSLSLSLSLYPRHLFLQGIMVVYNVTDEWSFDSIRSY